MISLSRNKRPIYVCPITINNSIATYGSPQKLYENYQITNTQADMKTFGLDAYKYIRIKTDASHLKYYHLGDRVYINNTPPEVEDTLCKNADYEVYKPPVVTFNQLEVLLKQRSGK